MHIARMLKRAPIVLLLLAWTASFHAAADQDYPVPTSLMPALSGRVVDAAHILDDVTKAAVEQKLAEEEAASSDQVVVVTLPDLDGRPIEDWGLSLGRYWGIGQAGKDNGVLLLVAPRERRVRIEVGYGLEGRLPDATASDIIRSIIIPHFKVGDMPGGIAAGVDAVLAVLGGGQPPNAAIETDTGGFGKSVEAGVFATLALLGLLLLRLRFRRDLISGKRHWYLMSYGAGGLPGHRGGGIFGGGGFSGGGGGFGGGGASGGW